MKKENSVLELAGKLLGEIRESGASLEEAIAVVGVVREMLPVAGFQRDGDFTFRVSRPEPSPSQ